MNIRRFMDNGKNPKSLKGIRLGEEISASFAEGVEIGKNSTVNESTKRYAESMEQLRKKIEREE